MSSSTLSSRIRQTAQEKGDSRTSVEDSELGNAAPLGAGGCDAQVPSSWQVRGTVEHGDQRGRLLGFPTANITIPDLGIPDGVWAGIVQVDPSSAGPTYLAAVSVGTRPTYYAKGKRLLEANLLGFSGDLYGHGVLVTLSAYIRPQRRFPGTAEFTVQLDNDVACVRAWGVGAGLVRQLSDTTAIENPSGHAMMPRRPFAIGHRRSKRRTDDVDQMKQERATRRLALIHWAIRELADAGPTTHEAVAKKTGIPLGYLKWAYPTSSSLLDAALRESGSLVPPEENALA